MGHDMSQTGGDMVLSSLSATNHCREDCGDLFQFSAFKPEASEDDKQAQRP